MWGIYRGRRLVLYVIAAIVIATLIGYIPVIIEDA